jgi:membrane protease YdiL (CAAX protease family)
MNSAKTTTRTKTLLVFIVTFILGYLFFIIPNLFFGIFKPDGGLSGINLLYIALFQFVTVTGLVYLSLKTLKKDLSFVGLRWKNWKKDTLLGLVVGLSWTALQFTVIIPNTGGAAREDVTQMISMFDGTTIGLISYLALGVIGGGITEEIFNRGFFINVLKDTFKNPKLGLWTAAILSILVFTLGHLPHDLVSWIDILVPTLAYTLLFLFTKRLTASIVAHGIYNFTAILSVYYLYVN